MAEHMKLLLTSIGIFYVAACVAFALALANAARHSLPSPSDSGRDEPN